MSSVFNQQHQNSDQVAQDIPADLKLLLRTVMRTFYSFELYLCMEMLMLYPCCKEDDLADLLRLDLKTLQQHLKNLKKEKFISEKALMETSSDGSKQCKHAYYFINYKMLVNIVKYKLDRIRIQIETEDKQFTTRAQFKCTQCMKTYTDLDTKDIFLTMRCVYCGADVDEDSSTLPASRQNGQRNLIHTFNTQMAVIFELLSKVEHIRLADHLLRPDPIDLSYILERNQTVAGSAANGNASNPNNHSNLIFNKSSSTSNLGGGGRANMIKYEKWSGDKTRNLDLLAQTKVSINFDSSDGSGAQARKPQKELPSILLLNRTQEEDEAALSRDRDSILLSQVKLAADETLLNSQSNMLKSPPASLTKSATATTLNPAAGATGAAGASNTGNFGGASGPGVVGLAASNTTGANLEQCIMQMLLKHEKKTSDQVVSSPSSTSSAISGVPLPPSPLVSSSNGISSISISKKRGLDGSEGNGFHSEADLNEFYKKRKLNSGDVIEEKYNGFGSYNNKQYSNNLKRIYSDGSENSDEYEDDEYNNHQFDDEMGANFGDSAATGLDDDNVNARRVYDSYDSYENSMNQLTIGAGGTSGPHGDLVNSKFIPRVSVQNRSIRFDRITPKLIGLMSGQEKENYINLCRQLYTEIYEI